MAQTHSVQELSLSGIAHRCARETELFFRRADYDPAYCFELFRRALRDRSQQAYELLYAQYQPLVAGWVERHASFASTSEEVQYFVNRAFEKMWQALTPDKFRRFPDLKSLLRYLKMCVHSVIVDYLRSEKGMYADEEPSPALGDRPPGRSQVEEQALSTAHHEAFWQAITARLNNEKEQTVIYGCFVLALKPRELLTRYEDLFADVNEVYRTKQNVLDRLRRDRELREFLLELA